MLPVLRAREAVSIFYCLDGVEPLVRATEGADPELLFACPECGATLFVNPAMRETLLSNGCVICGTDLGAADFEGRL